MPPVELVLLAFFDRVVGRLTADRGKALQRQLAYIALERLELILSFVDPRPLLAAVSVQLVDVVDV